jgi:hypothetical protein
MREISIFQETSHPYPVWLRVSSRWLEVEKPSSPCLRLTRAKSVGMPAGFWQQSLLLVSKSALGRGLGRLLGGNVHGSPKADSAPKTPVMSPGVATLFQGGKGANPEKPSGTGRPAEQTESGLGPPTPRISRMVKVSLVAGDVAILCLVAWLLLGSGKPLTSIEILISVLAVVLGAWLTCLALFLD